MKLEGRVAIITGAGRGIGRSISLALAREGAHTVVTARSLEEIEEASAKIQALNQEVLVIRTDISKQEDVARMVEQTLERFKTIDILVNNAGINLPKREVVDLTLEEWDRVLAINLTGTFLCTKAVLPTMIEKRCGKIINIASRGGRKGAAGRGPYRASKAGMINFTETVAAEVSKYGIHVNAICPGAADTRMLKEITDGGKLYEGKLIHPDEIAQVAVFLASDDSSAIIGSAIDAFGRTSSPF